MNYVSTYTYDDQTVSWTAPDPAMQFSNPYLGISNNPVNYIDPDGEFAIIPALLIAKKLAVAAKATAKVAATVAKVGAQFAVKGAKFAAKKSFKGKYLKANLKSGTINSISNYDGEEGLGLHTFGDFAAGFVGSAAGAMSGSKLIGMGVGGFATMGVRNSNFDYQGAQAFVGGALSVWSGMGALPGEFSLYKKTTSKTLFSKAAGADNKSFFAKNADAFFKYGIQAEAYNFAYTEQKKFKEQEWHQRTLIALTGASLGAVGQGTFLNNKFIENPNFFDKSLQTVIGAGSYYAEWNLSGWIKNRYTGGPKWGGSQRNKSWILGGKWGVRTWDIFNK